ncbi:hypothetical protein [Reichenbachiella ulvae]|uniref:Uncharacterized protein n=1 Tax=Reichenbachiella ulvae TaxID=2980104 RepID=A0ABT3CZQ1_9BACT|nr:hypothetical protein [Reichenbachiella ulvae]MCV9389166.1 hypothetical protein [Reichenbachiella ulvae]
MRNTLSEQRTIKPESTGSENPKSKEEIVLSNSLLLGSSSVYKEAERALHGNQFPDKYVFVAIGAAIALFGIAIAIAIQFV